jgi:hypothetical protein
MPGYSNEGKRSARVSARARKRRAKALLSSISCLSFHIPIAPVTISSASILLPAVAWASVLAAVPGSLPLAGECLTRTLLAPFPTRSGGPPLCSLTTTTTWIGFFLPRAGGEASIVVWAEVRLVVGIKIPLCSSTLPSTARSRVREVCQSAPSKGAPSLHYRGSEPRSPPDQKAANAFDTAPVAAAFLHWSQGRTASVRPVTTPFIAA